MFDFLSGMDLHGLGFTLLVVGVSGMVVELLNPGLIVPGVLGAVVLVVALFLLESLPLWLAGMVLILLLAGVAVLAVRAQRRKVVTGAEGLVGEEGSAETDLCPAGTVFVHGEIWRALADRPVRRGDRVRVTDVEGLTLRVTPLAKAGEVSCPPG